MNITGSGWFLVFVGASAGALACQPKAVGGGGLMPPEQAASPCGPEAMLDDMEDNDDQILLRGGRSGYWYTYADESGTQMEPAPSEKGGSFSMHDGGAHGSAYAARCWGTVGSGEETFAGIGFSLVDPMEPYDASGVGGVAFYAKKGAGSGRIRVKVPDVHTEPSAKVCKECYNDFGAEVELTDAWQRYVVPFSVMRQEPDWGRPRPSSITPSKIFGIQFQTNEARQPFDIWIDDVTFTGCK